MGLLSVLVRCLEMMQTKGGRSMFPITNDNWKRLHRSVVIQIAAVIAVAGVSAAGRAEQGSPLSLEAMIRLSPDSVQTIPTGPYSHIRMAGLSSDQMPSHTGQPQLPVMARFFLLPPDRAVSKVEFVSEGRVSISDHIRPYPILAPNDSVGLPDSPPWGQITYPSKMGFVSRAGQARQYRLAKVLIWPLEYDARSEVLTLATSIRVRLTLRPLTASEQTASLTFLRPETADDPFGRQRRWIADTVLNPEDLNHYYPRYEEVDHVQPDDPENAKRSPLATFIADLPSTEGLPANFVIITNDHDVSGNAVPDMSYVFQSFATETGMFITSAVVTVDEIEQNERYKSFDRPMAIQRFIRDAVQTWGTSFILLGGDFSIVPTRRMGGPAQDGWTRPDPIGDYWYTVVSNPWEEIWNNDGDAWIAEDEGDIGDQLERNGGFSSVWLSRLPARNAEDAWNMIQKTMQYDLYPPWGDDRQPPEDFYSHATIAAGPMRSVDLDESNGIYIAENFIIPTLEAADWTINREYPYLGGITESGAGGCPPWQDVCYKVLQNYIESKLPDPPLYWEANDLQEDLAFGTHFLYHAELSTRDRLGRPRVLSTPPECPGYPNWDRVSCQKKMENHLAATISPLDINQVLGLRNGDELAEYSIVFSSGGWTGMGDMDAIGEAFLRAPKGGAVAYAGKSDTWGGTYNEVFGRAVEKIFDPQFDLSFVVPSWYEAIDESPFGTAFDEIAAACQLQLFASPFLWAWTGAPRSAEIVVSPDPITSLGVQTITVTVRDQGTQTGLANARVTIQQGDKLYAAVLTDPSGVARFPGVLVQSSEDSIYVHAIASGCRPRAAAINVNVQGAPYISYASHSIDDCGAGGDCDSLAEVGESILIHTTLKNTGSSATQMGFAYLRATPSIVLRLKVNDTYRREDTILGRKEANPPAGSDSFRVPITTQGIRVEGEPTPSLNRESFRVWRAEGTGLYTIAATSASHSADTLFTGVITSEAGFSNVTKIGEANDQVFWDADSIWFAFHGDLTEDRISFRAEAPNWVSVTSPLVAIPALQPGDSTLVTYPVSLLSELPDQSDLAFTVSSYQGLMATNYFPSDFVIRGVKPKIRLSSVDRDFGEFGCVDTTWRWTPTIMNGGGGPADSVTLTLEKTAGAIAVLDSVVTFSRIQPDSFASGGAFVICCSAPTDTAGFRATIKTEVYHKNYYAVWHDGGGGGWAETPTDLAADLLDGTVLLRWNQTTHGSGYHIEYATSPDGARTAIADIGREASRYEVRIPLVPPGPGNGYSNPYYFFVSTRYGGICGPRCSVGPIFPWIRERENWPKIVSGSPRCAPLVADLNPFIPGAGRAIFVGSRNIHAWRPDGSPLRPGASHGLFYDFDNAYDADQCFVGALAFGDWNASTDNPEIAGNLRNAGTYMLEITKRNNVCCYGEKIMETPIYSGTSPIVASLLLPSNRKVLFLAGTSDRFIYAWDGDPDGDPIGNPYNQFAQYPYPDTSRYNYESLAIGRRNAGSRENEVIAVTRLGYVYGFPTDDLDAPAVPNWQLRLDTGWLSTPAVGDIDGDGDNDVVVTNTWRLGGQDCNGHVPGAIYVIDEDTGQVISGGQASSCDWHFRRGSGDVPPAGPALAQLVDEGGVDDGLEIVVAANSSEGVDEASDPVGLRLHVFDYADGGLVHYEAVDSIPFNSRNDEIGNVGGGLFGGAQYPIGTPIVGDFDYDGISVKPDVLVTTSSGAVFAFEFDQDRDPGMRLYPKNGWPILLPEVGREPVLDQLDPVGDPGQFSLVVLAQDGWLHVFDLPRRTEEYCVPAWPAYGRDGGNRRCNLSVEDFALQDDGPLTGSGRRTGIRTVRPMPARGNQEVVLYASSRQAVGLDVFDVAGRRVRQLYSGSIDAGETVVSWDGRLDGGAAAPSGIYWLRMSWRSGSQTRRVLLLH